MGIKHKTRAGERWRSRYLRSPFWGKELPAPKVTEDPLDDVRLLSALASCVALPPASLQSDAGDDLNRAAALLTDLDINKVN